MFYEKQTKIKILSQKADDYNKEFDDLEEKGHTINEIKEILKKKDYDNRQSKITTMPFEETRHVIGVGGKLHLGFDSSHKVLSNTKQQFKPVDEFFKEIKDLKKKGAEEDNVHNIYSVKRAQTMKESDKKMREQIYRDHLNDLVVSGEKMKEKSHYGENYMFTDEMQNNCDNQNFDYHLRKNDLKWYSEASVRQKGMMRK